MIEAIASLQDTSLPDETRTIGWEAVTWGLEYLQHPQMAAGTPFNLTREQLRMVLRWYEIDERGRFVSRRGVIRRMKGWGKDPFVAWLSCVELAGPCRFAGFGADGLPRAKPVDAPWIQIAAVSKTQTRNTMLLFPGMISDNMVNTYNIDIGKEIIYANKGRGQIQAVTSSARALEGSRPTLAVLNESHHWLQNNEGHDMADVIRRNLGKSADGQARSIEITNAHLPEEGSVAETTYDAWRQSGGNLSGVYYDSLESSAIADISDRVELIQGLTAARGDSTWLDVERLADEILDPATPEGMARRFYLNQVTKLGGTWLPDGQWDLVRRPSTVPRDTEIVLAFDGSFNGDSTALVAATVSQTPYLFVVGCWEAPIENPLWRVNIADVEEAIKEANRKWRVVENAADPYRWARSLEALEAEGLPMVEFPQSPSRMTPATAKMYELVVNERLTHDGDARLARHILNAVLYEDSRGTRIRKETKGSNKKIDLAVAAIMAVSRATTLATDEDVPRCDNCGAPLNNRLACDNCSPQIHSIRELVEEMKREQQQPVAPVASGPPNTGFVTNLPTTTYHSF